MKTDRKTGTRFELSLPKEEEMRSLVQLTEGGWGVMWQGCGVLRDTKFATVSEQRFQFKTTIYEVEGWGRHKVQFWPTLTGVQSLFDSSNDLCLKQRICHSAKLIDTVCETILERLISETPPVGPTPRIVLMCFRLELKKKELYLVVPGRKCIPLGIRVA